MLKEVTKTIKNEAKEQKGGFFGTLEANLLGNMLAGIGIVRLVTIIFRPLLCVITKAKELYVQLTDQKIIIFFSQFIL